MSVRLWIVRIIKIWFFADKYFSETNSLQRKKNDFSSIYQREHLLLQTKRCQKQLLFLRQNESHTQPRRQVLEG